MEWGKVGWGERIETVETRDDQSCTLLATIAIKGFYLLFTSTLFHLIPYILLILAATLTSKSQATSCGI